MPDRARITRYGAYNWSVTAVEVSYGQGESTPAHGHPGITIAYVLEGAIRSKVADPEETYSAGEMLVLRIFFDLSVASRIPRGAQLRG
jgi:quercetin dioxygenase-like cupin family protein